MANEKEITIKVTLDSSGAIKEGTKVKRSVRDLGSESSKSSKKVRDLGENTGFLEKRLSGVSTIITGAAAAAIGTVLWKATDRALKKGREFESQLAELEAITGISGEQLNRLGDQALDLSKKYATSASDIVEANKLVASQLAEKIDFGTEEGMQQLQDISEQAVVLKTAAGIELSEAVETTTSVINQFNLAAGESERVINTLAAGSKFGAAEVGDIQRAMVNAGSAAQSANVSLEETNAAIQVLAANGQVGERAGTALRAIFTRLKTESQALADAGIKNVNVESDGLVATLDKLRPLLEDTTAAKKIFGEEALNQIQILIREADAVESLNEKVTGTNTAYEQSATNLSTFDAAQKNLVNTLDAELIPAFQETGGVVVQLMDGVASLIEQFAGGIRVINQWLDVHSELRREAELAEAGTDSQIRAMTELRHELAAAAKQGDLTEQQQKDLREAYENTTQSLQKRADTIKEETESLKRRQSQFKAIVESLESQRDSEEGLDLAQRSRLSAVKQRLEALNIEISSNEEQLQNYHKAIEEGSLSFEEYIEKLQAAAEAEQKNTETTEQQTEAAKKQNEELGKEIELRRELNEVSLAGGGTVSQEEVEKNRKRQEEREKAREKEQRQQRQIRDSLVETEERYVSAADAAGISAQKTSKSMKMSEDSVRAVAAASRMVGDALAQAVLHGQNLGDILEGLGKQLASKALINGIGMLLTPGGFSGSASSIIRGLFGFGKGGVLPKNQRGGVLQGPSHARGGVAVVKDHQPIAEAEGNEAIINTRSTRMFYDQLSAINQAGGGRAFPGSRRMQAGGSLGSVPRRPEFPAPSGGGGINTAELAREISNAIKNVHPVVGISRMDNELMENENMKLIIGNN